MSDRSRPDLRSELACADGELVTGLRELARRRALGEDVSADDLSPDLQAHLDELLSAVLRTDVPATLPRQARRSVEGGRHLAVVRPDEAPPEDSIRA